MDLKKLCPDKLVTAEEATAVLKNGSRIFIGSGSLYQFNPSEPGQGGSDARSLPGPD
jgi:hypothetical protein